MRDFTVTAATDYRTRSRVVGDTIVRVYYRPGRAGRGDARRRGRRVRRPRARLGPYPLPRRSRSSSRPAAYGMESPGLIWIPTGVARLEPALPGRPRDGPPVVLRDRRQRPGERAVRRRGRRRLRGPLRPGPAARQPLRDGDARPVDLRRTPRRATTRRSTSRAATCSTTRGGGWARPRSGPRCAATSPRTGTGSSTTRRCSTRSTRRRRSTSAATLFGPRFPRLDVVGRLDRRLAARRRRRRSARASALRHLAERRRGSDRAPGTPAGDEPGRLTRARSRRPHGSPYVLADARRAAARPTATASRRRRPGRHEPAAAASRRPAARAAAGGRRPASSRATARDPDRAVRRRASRRDTPRTPRGRPAAGRPGRRTPARSAASPRRTRARRVARQRLEPGVVDGHRRVDERGVDPQRQLRVARRVARPGDPAMERVEPPDLGAGRGRRPVDDRQVAPQRARPAGATGRPGSRSGRRRRRRRPGARSGAAAPAGRRRAAASPRG